MECPQHCDCDGRMCRHAAWTNPRDVTHIIELPSDEQRFVCGVEWMIGTYCTECVASACKHGPRITCLECFVGLIERQLVRVRERSDG